MTADQPAGALAQRLAAPGPKRLLALDGGGIRGLITIGYLSRMEALLRERHGRPDMVLADYFDLVAGTSTGAIIASAIALGWPMARIRDGYRSLGEDAFRPKVSWFASLGWLLGARFDERGLERNLKGGFGDVTLGSPEFRSGLVIVAKRVDTASMWVLLNVPGHRYFEDNRDLRIWELLRASTAAPTFFRPHYVDDVGSGQQALFVDGGVSMHNSPALLSLMVASLEGYGLGWPLGEDRLLLCSVGSGTYTRLVPADKLRRQNPNQMLPMLVSQLIDDGGELGETFLQWMSRSPTARTIDTQIGSLDGDRLGGEHLLSYLRYNVSLEGEALEAIGMPLGEAEIRSLGDLSDVRNIDRLDALGQAAGERTVENSHFPPAFDLTSTAEAHHA